MHGTSDAEQAPPKATTEAHLQLTSRDRVVLTRAINEPTDDQHAAESPGPTGHNAPTTGRSRSRPPKKAHTVSSDVHNSEATVEGPEPIEGVEDLPLREQEATGTFAGIGDVKKISLGHAPRNAPKHGPDCCQFCSRSIMIGMRSTGKVAAAAESSFVYLRDNPPNSPTANDAINWQTVHGVFFFFSEASSSSHRLRPHVSAHSLLQHQLCTRGVRGAVVKRQCTMIACSTHGVHI